MVMLSTRFTGSSTSITVVSSRSARSTPVWAPSRAKCSVTNWPLGSLVGDVSPQVARDECGDPRRVPVEERLPVAGHRAVERGRAGFTHRGIPVVSGEHLVGALPGLDHLHVFGHFLAEQVEGDAVVADHRLAHRADRAVERGQHPVGADADLMVVGVEALGDDVRVLELVALDAADGFEADGERLQPVLTGFGQQPDDQAGVDAARQQASDRYVGDQPALDREPQRGENRVLPIAFGPVRPVLAAAEVGLPVRRRGATTVGLDRDERGRRDLADSAQDGARRRYDGVERQVAGAAQPGSIRVSTPPPASSAGSDEAKRTRCASSVT